MRPANIAVFIAGLLLPAAVLLTWRWLAPKEPIGVEINLLSDMVLCPPGVLRRTIPPEDIAIEAFFLDRFEVTRGEFAEYLRENPDAPALAGLGTIEEERRLGTDELPVSSVSLREAAAYAAARGKRLPGSDEWEWGARGPQGLRFPWGDGDPASLVANVLETGIGGPTPVGLFESGRSAFGAYDLIGNVAEWTATRVEGLFSEAHFVRGGGFSDPIIQRDVGEGGTIMDTHRPGADSLRSLYAPIPGRTSGPAGRSSDRGFRCALSLEAGQTRGLVLDLVARLGARDPWTWWRETRPARQRLIALGRDAEWPLGQVARRLPPGLVRGRVQEILARIEASRGDG